MAKLVYALNQSLDGYIDHEGFTPTLGLFRHFIEQTKQHSGCLYGRVIYDVMRYWDDDQPEWGDDEWAFATAWRSLPKWIVSRSSPSVGPNANLVTGDLQDAVLQLKSDHDGIIEVGGTVLAQSLTELGLIDEYRLYLHPIVLGSGKPFFSGPRSALRLEAHDLIDDNIIRLSYVPA